MKCGLAISDGSGKQQQTRQRRERGHPCELQHDQERSAHQTQNYRGQADVERRNFRPQTNTGHGSKRQRRREKEITAVPGNIWSSLVQSLEPHSNQDIRENQVLIRPIAVHPAGGDRIHPRVVVGLKAWCEYRQRADDDACRHQRGNQWAIASQGSRQAESRLIRESVRLAKCWSGLSRNSTRRDRLRHRIVRSSTGRRSAIHCREASRTDKTSGHSAKPKVIGSVSNLHECGSFSREATGERRAPFDKLRRCRHILIACKPEHRYLRVSRPRNVASQESSWVTQLAAPCWRAKTRAFSAAATASGPRPKLA